LSERCRAACGAAGDGAVGHRRASVRRGVNHQEEGQEGMLFYLFYILPIILTGYFQRFVEMEMQHGIMEKA